jgi:hypothetical protein
MARIGSAHAVRLVVALCAILAWTLVAAFSPIAASAGALEGVARPVGEAVGAPVQEVTETVTGTVPEAVTQPAQEATEPVVPPAKETAEKLPPAAKEMTETAGPPVKAGGSPPAHLPGSTPGPPSAAAKSAGSGVGEAAGTVNRTVENTEGAVGGAGDSAPSSSGGGNAANIPDAAPTNAPAARGPDRPAGTTGLPDVGPGANTFEAPSSDGAVRAPLPKWMAYVWPAIALTGPGLADLLGRWERQSARLALGAAPGGSASGEGPVVAGVHAHGGRPKASDSSASPFPKITAAIGHALNSEAPTSLLVYLCLVAIAAVAVFWAVSREIVVGRRGGRDR